MDSIGSCNQQSRTNCDALSQCRTASVKLSWPAYSANLVHDGATAVDSHYGPIYTSPVTNYSLQFAEITSLSNTANARSLLRVQNVLSSHDYAAVQWFTYEPSPLPGQESEFEVFGLAANTAYIFRIAAQSDHGQSPFSVPSAILSTRPTAPCQAPTHVRAKLVHMNLDKLLLRETATNPAGTLEACHRVLVQWKVIVTCCSANKMLLT
ncbi:hypothetical protein EG68_02153 [Paragonimus skrjabini miyazakii]|uniref:Fibronectin type-III domain-containing protein n=1 Tax=Paragonimus skrjabini miyazakii TaxID=59628 RepID=A0A8S9Z5H3_9TREM|nr:hypothetical protein EG68_02153 [Paragonimus skrjabini miyazakii]